MKRTLILIIIYFSIFCFILTLGKIWLNTLGLQGTASSDNIEFSKANNLLINEYTLINDSITRKYKLNNDNVKCWTEHVWHTKAKYIYWHPIQIVEGFQILLERSNNIDTTIKLSIEKLISDEYGGSPVVFAPNGSVETISEIQESDTLKAFIYSCPSSPPLLLDSFYLVRIKKISTLPNTVFKQTRAVLVVAGSGVSPTLFRVIQNWF